jgi:hypothetical protein
MIRLKKKLIQAFAEAGNVGCNSGQEMGMGWGWK